MSNINFVTHSYHALKSSLLQKKRFISGLFRAHACEWARRPDHSSCRAVLCHGCYDRKKTELVDKSNNGRRQSSRRLQATLVQDDKDTYAMDGPEGKCQHTNTNTFQPIEIPGYFDEKYMGGADKVLNPQCIQCGVSVLD